MTIVVTGWVVCAKSVIITHDGDKEKKKTRRKTLSRKYHSKSAAMDFKKLMMRVNAGLHEPWDEIYVREVKGQDDLTHTAKQSEPTGKRL